MNYLRGYPHCLFVIDLPQETILGGGTTITSGNQEFKSNVENHAETFSMDGNRRSITAIEIPLRRPPVFF